MQTMDLWGQVGAYVALDVPTDTGAVKKLVGPAGGARADLRSDTQLHVDGSRIRADIDGVTIGWVPMEMTDGYLPVLKSLHDTGHVAQVKARVQVFDTGGAPDGDEEVSTFDPYVSAYISLAEPHLLLPLNAPPEASFVELPEGRKQKVSVTATPAEFGSAPWIREEGAGWVYCLLRPRTEKLARTSRDVVDVRIGSTTIGSLTPAMSKNFLPLITLIVESGRLPVARGLVKGNHLQIEMNVAALKSSEVSQSWLRDNGLTAQGPSASLAAPDVEDDPIVVADQGTREPGFYADPQDVADERFWDGFEWTTRIRMRPKPRL